MPRNLDKRTIAEIKALKKKGYSDAFIARTLGVHRLDVEEILDDADDD